MRPFFAARWVTSFPDRMAGELDRSVPRPTAAPRKVEVGTGGADSGHAALSA